MVHQLIFSSRRHPRAPIGFWYRAPSNSRQLGFGVQQLKESGVCGRSISSGTHCANMIKNMSFQRPTKVCFAVMVNARTPQVVDMNARTKRFAIRLNSRTPPRLLSVSMPESLLYARTLEAGFHGGKERVPELCRMPEPVHARTTQVPFS